MVGTAVNDPAVIGDPKVGAAVTGAAVVSGKVDVTAAVGGTVRDDGHTPTQALNYNAACAWAIKALQ